MKKTISVLAIVMMLCLAFASFAGAVTTSVYTASGVTAVKTVTNETTTLQYFMHTNDTEFENVEVNGERMLKGAFPLNFRITLTPQASNALDAGANTVGYSYYRIRLKTTGGGTGMLGGDEQIGNVLYDRAYFVDLNGELVSSTASYQITFPANFDGYLYIGLTHWTWQGGAQASRDKDSADPVLGPEAVYGANHYYYPGNVSCCNCNWTFTSEIYFGDTALVEDLNVVRNVDSVHTAPANLNYVILEDLDAQTNAANFYAYTGAGSVADTAELITDGADKYIQYTFTESQDHGPHIPKFVLGSTYNVLADNDGVAPAGLGFYIRTGAEPVTLVQVVIEGQSAHGAQPQSLYDMNGFEVATGTGHLEIPANFEGYVRQEINTYDITLGSYLMWLYGEGNVVLDDFGYYAAMPTALADVEILGVQESAVDNTNGTFDARIVCGVNDLLFRELKFHYNALENGYYHWTDEQVADVTEVYTTIQIDGIADAEAATFGYNYLAALTIQGIPATGTIEILVEMSYVREADLSTELTTALYSIIYIDGVFQSFGIA